MTGHCCHQRLDIEAMASLLPGIGARKQRAERPISISGKLICNYIENILSYKGFVKGQNVVFTGSKTNSKNVPLKSKLHKRREQWIPKEKCCV